MECVTEPDLAAFAERVVPFLSRRPLEHSVLLTIIDARVHGRVVGDGPPVCAYVCDDLGEVVGVSVRTPPMKTVLSVMPEEAAVCLEDALAVVDPGSPAVLGPVELARVFAERRTARRGGRPRAGMALRMYALGELAPPRGIAGAAHLAGPADQLVLVRWWDSFGDEALPEQPRGNLAEVVANRLRTGAMHVWEVDGEPVAMAGYQGPLHGVARVAPVYTPPEHRRRGYGAAVTAATTAHALQRGAQTVILHADLSNPTSNSIYQQIGYRPLTDTQDFHFA